MHHENEPGKGMKGKQCSDYRGVPVCFYHHWLMETPGMGRKSFWREYKKDPEKIIEALHQEWERRKK